MERRFNFSTTASATWFVGIAGFAIGVTLGIGWFFLTLNADRFDVPILIPSDSVGEMNINDFDPSVANPSYGPSDVVRLQLLSMQKAAGDPSALIVCYSLASADNRRMTGPLSRFAKLFQTDAYGPLLGHVSSMIGRPTVDGDRAFVTATVISKGGQSHAFEFALARYQRNPDGDKNEDSRCWMTYSVAPVVAAVLSASDDIPELDEKSFR